MNGAGALAGRRRAPPRQAWALPASLALHAAALAAMLHAAREAPPPPAEETGVALVWADLAAAEASSPADTAEDSPRRASPAAEATAVSPGPAPLAAGEVPSEPPAALPEAPFSAPAMPDPPQAAEALPLPPPPPPAPPPRPAVSAATPPVPRPAAPAPPPETTAGAADGDVAVRLHLGASLLSGPTQGPQTLDQSCARDATEYPEEALRRGVTGSVLLRLRISDDGRVVAADVAESSGHAALDEAARRGVRRCRFRPALRGGQPVWSSASWRITFDPQGTSARRPARWW